jgi:hypothetical protein
MSLTRKEDYAILEVEERKSKGYLCGMGKGKVMSVVV